MKRVFLFMISYLFLSQSTAVLACPTHEKAQAKPTSNAQDDRTCPIFFKKAKLCGQLTWITPPKKVELPTENDSGEFNLSLYAKKPNRKLSSDEYTVEVRPYMPSMGHGSPLTTQVNREINTTQDRKTQFQVKRVFFSMPGQWELQIQLKKGNQIIDEARVPYTL